MKRLLLIAVVVFGLSTASLATCAQEGQVGTFGSAFATGAKAAVSIGPTTGCYVRILEIHARMINVGSAAVATTIQATRDSCGGTPLGWGQWIAVNGATNDRDEVNESGLAFSGPIQTVICIQFSTGLANIKESLTVTYLLTANLQKF